MSAVEALEPAPVLEVVIPVHNEEVALPRAVAMLTRHLAELPWTWQVTIADNASTDATPLVARRLAHEYDGVRVVTLAEKGRGRALKQVWRESQADVLAYMDVDLSTDLNAVLPLVAPLISGHSDVAIGSRLSRGARVTRGPRRELVSRSYNVILRSTLRARFRDAQCGFKALRRDVAEVLLPLVEDDTWFFDTELLVLAERSGLRIHEVPVDWVDDPDSRVDVVRTALDDLRGIRRLAWSLATGRLPMEAVRAQLGTARAQGRPGTQVALFAAVGVLSTLAYAVLYLGFRQWMPGLWANALALLVTAIGNTAANRRFTFAVSGGGHLRHHAQGLAVFGVGLAMTSGSLWLLEAVEPTASHRAEVVVLTIANLVVTVMRFLAMRLWMFAPRLRTAGRPRPGPAVTRRAVRAPRRG
ncbi:bifunctional glycosyltransferase family 2/GtrA family protein [Nocardioides sp. Root140]|uniref:bifunctional glycosyltransferase family 2/GtrA family protein n=1 Tax=Nocardioides sp. Root140 TaxID=1736460 RepID=UPI0006FBF855|nr:bifunctional glycosyltransferase family 2/GtrA family protein [Nocardioides sp. Root140]KQY55537.1 sugar translocase [Nocardioides sp. Root140]